MARRNRNQLERLNWQLDSISQSLKLDLEALLKVSATLRDLTLTTALSPSRTDSTG